MKKLFYLNNIALLAPCPPTYLDETKLKMMLWFLKGPARKKGRRWLLKGSSPKCPHIIVCT